jgi:hypothetical protein
MLATVMLLTMLAHGAVAQPLPPGDLAFGLEKLHWGMSLRDARSRYPGLEGAPVGSDQLTTTLSLPDYAVLGCRFAVSLEFARGRLDQVTLDSNGVAHLDACNDRIKAALSRQYGGDAGGFSTARNPHGYSEYASWGGPVTEITYGALKGGFIMVRFSPAGQTQLGQTQLDQTRP